MNEFKAGDKIIFDSKIYTVAGRSRGVYIHVVDDEGFFDYFHCDILNKIEAPKIGDKYMAKMTIVDVHDCEPMYRINVANDPTWAVWLSTDQLIKYCKKCEN